MPRGRHGHDRMVVGFTTTCTISAYHPKSCEFEPRKLFATGRWFSSGTPVSSTNKTDRHDMTEILLKVALSTINLNPNPLFKVFTYY